MTYINIPLRLQRADQQTKRIVRGGLYNLDRDEYFYFQHQPLPAANTQIGWADDFWNGTMFTHAQFQGLGQTELTVDMRVVVDPNAPQVVNNLGTRIMHVDGAGNKLLKIEDLQAVLELWAYVQPALQRSSIVMYFDGFTYYTGRMVNLSITPEAKFSNGRLRRALLSVGIKQWRTPDRLR